MREEDSKAIKKQSILIVDDVLLNREMLANVFAEDFSIVQAENGRKALDILVANPDITVVILDIMMPVMDGYEVLDAMQKDPALKQIPVIVVTAGGDEEAQIKALDLGALDVIMKPFSPKVISRRIINIIERNNSAKLEAQNRLYEQQLLISEIDEKTGIFNKQAFCRRTAEIIKTNPDTQYVICRLDIDNFKVYNDAFGVAAGDKLLLEIGNELKKTAASCVVSYGHLEADHFVACIEYRAIEQFSEIGLGFRDELADSEGFDFVPRLGYYLIGDIELNVSLMCDRALLALRSIKNSYSERTAWYEESMRSSILEEQEVINEMNAALSGGQFKAFLQPQYDYYENKLSGAEVLVRWIHPKKGMISPARFIPVFENNGFISKMDEYIWEQACRMLREWLDKGIEIVPISVNISRIDIYNPHLPETLKKLIDKYGIDASMLRLEITESAYMDAPGQLIKTVNELQETGFCIEMDDFGSGYSSFNTLKDVPVDILKIDMRFLEATNNESKSGKILYSIMRMADLIELPVIAEGVETSEQADHLLDIGCAHMQGYYFAKPMPENDFALLLKDAKISSSAKAAVKAPSLV